ncbi:MAG: hypothetical protein HY695_14325 [Deltaproteobacteria bacterium]|nr:hypothetical protein [Deltaproteobacteria bacterium]
MTISLLEDFIEATDKLDATGSSGSTNPRVDGAGGLVEIRTGAANGNYRQLQTKSKNVDPRFSPIFSAYLRTKDTTYLETFIGLADGDAGSAQNLIGFYRSDAGSAGSWQRRFRINNGTPDNQDLLVPGTTNFIEMMAQVSVTEVSFFLNGRLVRVDTSNFPTTVTNLMYFVLWIKATSASERTLVVDYAQLTASR